jgi:hypothetical protein
LDFDAVEALITEPEAKRRRLVACANPRLCNGWPQPPLQQFSWSLLERRHALALMKVTPYEVHSLWPLMGLVDVLNAILEHFAFWRQSVT